LIHPDECERVWDTIQSALKEHKPFQLTYRIKTADGEQKWVLEQGQGTFTPKGELLAIEGFISDTTEKVQMQESIKESECFLSEVFASIQDGISVLDTDLNIVRVNPSIENVFEDKKPLVGRKCYEVYHGRTSPCADCPTILTIENGKAGYKLIAKYGLDGKIIRWFDLYSFPLIDAATGKLKGVIEYVRDVTANKLTGESLHEIEEQYKAVIEITDTGFVAVDDNGLVLNANLNYAHLVGHSSINEIIGQNITEWTAPYDLKRNEMEIGKCFEKGSIRNLEIDYQRTDGTIVPVEINANAIQTKNGKMIVILCRDITERKAAENTVPATAVKLGHY
jgi:PAS domain S-box-containing protein